VALHVLDVMESISSSAATGRATPIGTTCTRPERLTGLITIP